MWRASPSTTCLRSAILLFKQKTAYEMRISDWSSDVCSSDLALDAYGRNLGIAFQLIDDAIDYASDGATMGKDAGDDFRDGKVKIGRASCRERVCQYV